MHKSTVELNVPAESASTGCACVLLAAGESTRLGYPKQLLRRDAETLLHRAARIALESHLEPTCVVVGSRADELRLEIQDLPIEIVINADWKEGMGASMRIGIEHLTRNSPAPPRILVLLCDQVGVSTSHLISMLAAAEANPEKIVASFYQDRPGVPAIFPSAYFPELLNIHGDQGARQLLQDHASNTVLLPFAGGEFDVDTAEDVKRAGLEWAN